MPSDRNLEHRCPPSAGEEHQLDVKREAVDGLGAGQRPPEGAWKQLEPALGISDSWQQERLHQQVEGAAHEIPVPRLADEDEVSVDRS